MNKWWAYKHVNGAFQVKRYFDEADLIAARESDFIEFIVQPFEAEDRKDAEQIVRRRLGSHAD